MPLDSVTISALAKELREQIVGARIDKVQQPERDTIVLSVRTVRGNRKLLISGGVGCARAHFTESDFENPQQPPMFCMLLRKHLSSAIITKVEQPSRERILIFYLDACDELGIRQGKKLVLEMIGRGTNIILIDQDDRIIDCLRRVDSDMSEIRQVLPGLIYRLPLRQSKPDFFLLSSFEREDFWLHRPQNCVADKWLLNSFSCLSPLICRELVSRSTCLGEDLPLEMNRLADNVLAENFTPYMLMENTVPKDFSFMRIMQYGDSMSLVPYSSFSQLLDSFYTQRGKVEEMRRRTADLRKTVKNARDRAVRKAVLQSEELKNTSEREKKRRWGDLITANLYRAPKIGSGSMTVEDFYEEGAPLVSIPLDRRKSPQQNAAFYYKEYSKAKTAETYLTRLLAETRRDESYLNSVLDEIERAETDADILDIRRELTETGFIKPDKNKRKQPKKENKPIRYTSSSGFEILAGRNNIQNDELTKNAHRGDIWLHIQKIHGSHVVIRCEGSEVDSETLREAAIIAAYHSQADNGGKVAVDYTRARNVKKPHGSLPGMVTYTDYSTLLVEANEEVVNNLLCK